jgi:hypothetical protein
VAFDDVDMENGAMQVLPGSNHWGLLSGRSDFLGTDLDAQLERRPTTTSHRGCSRCKRARSASTTCSPFTAARRTRATAYADPPCTSSTDVASVSHTDGWQHYNLGLLQQRGGEVGDAYDIDELWPVVFPVS